MSVPPSKWSSETSLNQLHSRDESELLDVIDQLRFQGVGRFLGEDGLPQLIVAGDQSSGKSSVLEALTRVRFPIRSKQCTTFATELKLRRSTTSRISTRIKPGPNRTEEDKQRLARFKESCSSPEQFPELIDLARACMKGIDRESSETFFDDILQVEIFGPDLAPLTVVDLPGIIHFHNNDQEVSTVSDLVQKYMRHRNSIILAVVAASNDYNNQIILKYATRIVPGGERVLGIITKPDTLTPDSDRELDFLNLARNTEIKFEHGWHVVRNWDSDTKNSTFEERDQVEQDFFENSSWAGLPTLNPGLGISSLRQRLSEILLDHIRTILPSIRKKLSEDREESEGLLRRLGSPRETTREQQDYLSNISDAFYEHMQDALDGIYRRSKFFNGEHRRLRAVIRNLNEEFAIDMLQKGQKWYILPDDLAEDSTPIAKLLTGRAYLRSKFLHEVVLPLVRSERGHELPGVFNHLLIGSLFRRQMEPWENLAKAHIQRVWFAINRCLEEVLGHITNETTCNNLLMHVIDPAMKSRQLEVMKKLQELLLPHRDYEPMNLDPTFFLNVQTVNPQKENSGSLDKNSRTSPEDPSNLGPDSGTVGANDGHGSLSDQYECSNALDAMQSYYKPAMIQFINNVASLGIEQCLLVGLPKIFSSATVRNMNDDILIAVAAESRAIVTERSRLSKKLELLETGLETIRRFTPRGMHEYKMLPSSQPDSSSQRSTSSLPLRQDTKAASSTASQPVSIEVASGALSSYGKSPVVSVITARSPLQLAGNSILAIPTPKQSPPLPSSTMDGSKSPNISSSALNRQDTPSIDASTTGTAGSGPFVKLGTTSPKLAGTSSLAPTPITPLALYSTSKDDASPSDSSSISRDQQDEPLTGNTNTGATDSGRPGKQETTPSISTSVSNLLTPAPTPHPSLFPSFKAAARPPGTLLPYDNPTRKPSFGGSGLFGGGGLDSSTNKPLFDSKKTSTSGGGIFGSGSIDSSLNKPLFGGFASNLSQTSFGSAPSERKANNGTAGTPFHTTIERDGNSGWQLCQSITFQPEYQHYSLEELRVVDYAQSRRYGS